MKILVLGGTGAMGEELIPLLALNSGNMIVVTSRKKHPSSLNVRFIQEDAMNIDFIKDILSTMNFDVIVDFMLYSVDEFEKRYEIFLRSCKQYLFFSSARVYAASSQMINEDSPRLLDVSTDQEFLVDEEYSLKKAKEEDILLHSYLKNWVIIRPYKTFNKNRLQLGVLEKEGWIYRAIAGKKVVTLGNIAGLHTSMTSAKDTARVLQRIIGDTTLNGQMIQIANPENITWGNVIDIYSECIEKRFGHKIEIYPLQDTSDIELLLGNRYRIKYDGLVDRRFDDKKVRELMGNDFVWTPTKEEITKCVDAWLEERELKRCIPDYKVEGTYDRATREWESIMNMHGLKNLMGYMLYRLFDVSSIRRIKAMIKKS